MLTRILTRCASLMCRIVSWHGRLQATCRPRLNLLQNFVQEGIALAQLLVVLQTLRHTGEAMAARSRKAKSPCPHASGVLTSATRYSGVDLPRHRPAESGILCGTSQAGRLSNGNSGGRNLPQCLLLARFQTPGYGRRPTEARIDTQKGPAACMPWRNGWLATFGLTFSRAWLALDRLSSRGTCSKRLHKVSSHWPGPRKLSVTHVLSYTVVIPPLLSRLRYRVSVASVNVPPSVWFLETPSTLQGCSYCQPWGPAVLFSAWQRRWGFLPPSDASGLHSGRNNNHARPRVLIPSRSFMAENVANRSVPLDRRTTDPCTHDVVSLSPDPSIATPEQGYNFKVTSLECGTGCDAFDFSPLALFHASPFIFF